MTPLWQGFSARTERPLRGLSSTDRDPVKKTSSGVLTRETGLAYKPPIETAPPLSGASSALPKDAGADVRVTGRVPVGICRVHAV